jgi:apolipoprotein D and lipocalin family protein
MIYSLVIALVLLVVAIQATPFNSTKAPDTVDSLDIPKYLGLWYQMSADQIVYSTFEKDAYCATALYGDNGDGTISVHNYAATGSPNGPAYVIDGYAYPSNPSEPGQLKVVFNSDDALPVPAPYWVLELGPVNSNGQYDYSIVSDNISFFLFVLARDVNTFNTQYRESVSKRLTELGFQGVKAPIDTYQNADCTYESTKRQAQIKKFQQQK